jgi:hypothetical protein
MGITNRFQVEVMWNREFRYASYGAPFATLGQARAFGRGMLESGDGARVKNARVYDTESGEYHEVYGRGA